MNRRRVGKKGGVLLMERYEFTQEQQACLERMKHPFAVYQFLRILQNSEVKKHKVFLKIKKDFTPSNANK